MDELELLVQAILSLKDTAKSKEQILSELPKLEQQLQSDKNARIKIIAGLDIAKSKSLIQSQLNTLASQAKAPTIKVGVDVCGVSGSIGQVNQIAKSVNDSIKTQISGRNYASDNSAFIEQIKTLQDEKTAVDNLVKAFGEYGIAIKNATSTKKLDENGNLSGLTIQVQSATGEVEKFEYTVQETSKQTSLVLENITATDSAVQRLNQSQTKLIQSQAKFNDQLKATSTKLESQLNNIKSNSSIGGKPIDFDKNEDLVAQWNKAYTAIKQVENANKTTMASMVADAEKEISTLQQMIKEFQNTEYAATSLRNKKPSEVKDTYKNELDGFINKINNSKVCIEDFGNGADNAITKLKTSCEKISDAKSLTEFLNQFDEAKSKFKSLESFYKGIGQYDKELDKLTESWKKQGVYTDEVKAKIEELKGSLKNISIGNTDEMSKWVENFNDTISKINVDPERQKQLTKNLNEQIRLTNQILQKEKEIENIKNKPYNLSKISELNKIIDKRKEELSKLEQESATMTDLMSKDLQRQYVLDNTSKALEAYEIAQKNAADMEQRSYELTQKKATALEAQIKTYETINTKAAKAYKSEFDSLKKDLELAKATGTPEEIDKIRARYTTLTAEIKAAGKEGQTFFQKMIDGAKKFSSWMSLTTIISTLVRDIRKMVTTVVEFDTALIDLKKTFKGTEQDLKDFYYAANDVAKQLGVTTAEVIKQASAWSRLGFSTKQQAIEMAKLSSMFASISPGMDVDTATDGLLSIIKAFGYETDEVLDGIMSKINIVGNEFGTSNSEIVEMLRRSSSAMKEANNNLADTIALETSAVEITRDAAGVGTAFKTISMRLRGYDEDVEAYTNDVEVLSGEIANLTKTAKTPGGISLFTDANKTEYKSTIQLLREISEIYDELSDKNQAELLETVAGKRQGQIVAAVLKNWDTVENALESMENADGSAMREMEVIMESLSYKINEFKQTFTGIAQDSLTQDFLKSMIDSGIRLLETFSDASPILQNFLNIISGGVTGVTAFVKQIGLIPTIFAGLSLKNVGELNQNTPVYALSLTKCA